MKKKRIILYHFIIIKERDCHSKLIIKKLIIQLVYDKIFFVLLTLHSCSNVKLVYNNKMLCNIVCDKSVALRILFTIIFKKV